MVWERLLFVAIFRQVAKHFGVGLVTVLPFALVIWVVVSVFNIVDSWLGPFFDTVVGASYPGAGFLIVIIAITLVGVLTRVWVSHYIILSMDSMFKRIPYVKSLYSMVKEIVDNLLGQRRRGFQRTVLVEWPDQRALVVGFVTSENLSQTIDPDGTKIAVYIPNAFQFAGVTAIVERDKTRTCEMSIEEALKFTLSAGLGEGSTAGKQRPPADNQRIAKSDAGDAHVSTT